MKNMTIRGIDTSLDQALRKAAKAESNSVNQLVVNILRERFGLAKAPRHTRRHHDLDELFGAWSENHYQDVENALQQQRGIDPELWR
jgi:plasmid stability protein